MPHFVPVLLKCARTVLVAVVSFALLYAALMASFGDTFTLPAERVPVEFEVEGITDEDFIWHSLLVMPPFIPVTTAITAAGLALVLVLVFVTPVHVATWALELAAEQSPFRFEVPSGIHLFWRPAVVLLTLLHPSLALFWQWLLSILFLLMRASLKSQERNASLFAYQLNVLSLVSTAVWFKTSCVAVALTHPFSLHWLDRDMPAIMAVNLLSLLSMTTMLPRTQLSARYSGVAIKGCALLSLITSGHHHYVAIDGLGLACAYLLVVHVVCGSWKKQTPAKLAWKGSKST